MLFVSHFIAYFEFKSLDGTFSQYSFLYLTSDMCGNSGGLQI